MKKSYPLILLFFFTALLADAAKTQIGIDPPHWWTGMKNDTLQLQLHGENIRSSEVAVDYPGVRIVETADLDGSHDWKYVYLLIGPETPAGKMRLKVTTGKNSVTIPYELRERNRRRAGAAGFSSADVLYLLMPDRFADGNPDNNRVASLRFNTDKDSVGPNTRHGGDFAGVMSHLDYIDSLGVTAVWFNPVLENDMPGGSYHGYATTDYYRVDPRFGTNGEYAALVDSLHSRGIKTVMDMIFNHCGSQHPWALDPPASDWFNNQNDYHQTNYRLSTLTDPYASDYDRKLTTDGWFVREMPDLNQRNRHLMKYLSQNSIWWIEETGIDGIRMDTYPYADADRMRGWISDVEKEYPDFTIVGECWLTDPGAESYWQRDSAIAAAMNRNSGLPVVMDFGLMTKSRDMAPFRENTDAWHGLSTLYDHIGLDFLYPDPKSVLRFYDNHDTERFIVTMPETLDGWKQAMTFLLTTPGIPQIYYGTELLMSGTRAGGDGNVRKNMPGGFPGDTTDSFCRNGRTEMQNEAYDFLSRLNRWRRNSKAVAEGTMKHFMPDNGAYVYRRKAGEDEVVVIINGRDENTTVSLERYSEIIPADASYDDVLTGRGYALGKMPELELKPREILILQKR